MKTLKLMTLFFLMFLGIQQSATAQCQASFTYAVQGDTVFYWNTSTGNYSSLQWWLGNGSTSTQNNPVTVYTGPGIYGVCLTVWDSLNGCQSTFCDTIVVAGSAGCQAYFGVNYLPGNSSVQFVNQSVFNGVSVNYLWDFGDGSSSILENPAHSYAAPGNYTVCLSVYGNGCWDQYCGGVNIQSSGNCDAMFSAVDSSGNFFFIPNTLNPNYSYSWSFGDSSTSSSPFPVHQYSSPGIYFTCLTVTDSSQNCVASWCDSVIVVNTNCDAEFTYFVSSGNAVYFTPSNFIFNVHNVVWSFGDGTTSTSPTPMHIYQNAGTYPVCLTITNPGTGCSDTWCDSVFIAGPANCNAAFTTVDSSGFVYFMASNYNPAWDYIWQYGDGTSGTGPSSIHIYNSAGPWVVCLTVIDSNAGCSDYWCDTILVTSAGGCMAQMSISQLSSNGFFFQSLNNTGAVSYFWEFGDGNNSTSGSLIYQYPVGGTYQVCLTVTYSNGCVSIVCDTVTVLVGGCQAYFTHTLQANNTVSFTNQSSATTQTTYFWNFGDGTTSTFTSPNHFYASPGVYAVCLTMIDSLLGCTDTWCDTVVVSGSTPCNANFQAFDSLNTWYFIPANGNYTNYYWTFGDGTFSTATYPTHVYSGQGLYDVCLTVTDSVNGCTATWCDSIYIQNNGCQAYFGYYADTTQSNTFQFMDLSAGNYTGVYWSFGDGQSSTTINPSHTYANSGTYIVCLTIYGTNCQDSYCDTVVVGSGSNCVPTFWAMPDSVFGNGNVTFYINNNCAGWQYIWNFGDSTTGSGFGPFVHQYPATGWYYVCVTAFDGNGNVITWCDSVYAFRLGATGLSELNNAIPVNVYPNPSNGAFFVRVNLETASPLTIEVLSIEGQLLHRTEQDHPSGVSEFRLDQSVLSAGVYFLRVRAAEQQTLTRFIIQR